MVPFRKFGIPISVPKPLVTGILQARTAAAAVGLPRELGGVVGAASPIVAGAVRGARAALAERAAQAAAAAEEAPIGPPALTPRPALPPAAIVTPAPADTSFVRGVPAEYAQPEPLPLSRQLPPGTDLRQMPAAGDTSYVRAIPAEYPPVEPGFAPEQPASGGTAATPPAPTAPTPTPGQLYAESTGEDWAKLSPKNRALMEQIAQARANVAAQPEATPPAAAPQVAPQTPPAAPEPPAPPPTAPPTPEAPAPRLSSQDLARQLEASMRVETLTDYLARNKVPAAMLDIFGDKEWRMVADQAGVQPPDAANIQAIRGNLADYEGAAQITAKTPADAAAEFAQNRSIRTKRQAPAAPADLEGQLADSVAAVQKGERPAAAPPPDEPAALTASQKRVEAFAQHLAADKSVTSAQLANLPSNPQALALLEQLGESLDIEGRPAPGEPQAIVDRVRELRGEPMRKPPASATTATAITKEPWEMTRAEFISTYPERTRAAVAREVQRNISQIEPEISQARIRIAADPDNPANASMQTWIKDAESRIEDQRARLSAPIKPLEENWSPAQIEWHHVGQALREGKPVPPEVLADYPDLTAQQPTTLGDLMQPKPARKRRAK